MKHTALYVLLLFAVLACLSSLCIFADGTEFSGGYTDVFLDIDSLVSELPYNIDTFSGVFDFSGDNVWNVKRKFNDTYIVSVNPGTGKRGYVSYNFEALSVLKEYDTLAFGIRITTNADIPGQIAAESVPYRIVLDIYTDTGMMQSYVYVNPNEWTLVRFNIDGLSEVQEIKKHSIRVEYVGKEVPDRVEMTSLYADNIALLLDSFTTNSITVTDGELSLDGDVLHLMPDSSGRVEIAFEYLHNALPEDTDGFMLAVTIQGNKAVGSLAAGVLYKGDQEVLTTSPLDLREGLQTYLLPLPSYGEDGNISTSYLDAYYLYFYDMEPLENEAIILSSVTVCNIPPEEEAADPLPAVENLGTILSFGIADDEIVFSGKLSRSAVIRYIDDKIMLYAVPSWNKDSMENAVLLGECSVSNSYSITLPLSAHRTYAENWMFFLALSHKDPDDPNNQILYLLNEPRFLTGRSPAASSLSILGLHDANAVGVFESNVSHVVVDIPLHQLLLKNGSTVCSRNGRTWHLNSALLTELDSEIQFYADAGLEVCLRIYADSPIAGLTYMSSDAEWYLPYLTTEDAVEQYTAIISFLCKRYPAIDAIMLGSGINSEKYTGIPMDEPFEAVQSIADLAALTYSAAAASVADVYLIVPFTDEFAYGNDPAEEIAALAPEFFSMLFAHYLDSLGNIPWVFGYNFHTMKDDTFALPDAVSRNLRQMGFPAPADTIFMWIPGGDTHASWKSTTLVQNYADLCTAVSSVKLRALILSLENISQKNDPQMYSAMKDIQVENSSRVIWDHPAEILESTVPSSLSSLTLYDFSSAYSSLGWVAGGGITEMYTRQNPLFSAVTPTRTLRSLLPVSTDEDGGSGIAGGVLLRNFSRTLDLRGVDEITFRLALTDLSEVPSAATGSATVIFILGSQDRRAEYYAYTVPCGKTINARCALHEYENADQISYVGVMVYANDTITLDLSSVSFSSHTLAQEELEALFYGKEEEADTMEHFTEIFYILIITMILTICAAVLLIRRDREEMETTGRKI
ncbi:MAG: hypothetical protein IJ325_08280 [Clostridia bacterium]|nr:hypothetical protein [Clostridia bacterium]